MKLFLVFFVKLASFIIVTTAFSAIDHNNQEIVAFVEIHRKAGIKSTKPMGHSASWGDFNNDGCLDLIATNTSLRKTPRTFLYMNKCDGTFYNTLPTSGLSDFYLIGSTALADINNDGMLDLALGDIDIYNDPMIYLNLGSSKFIDISEFTNITVDGFKGNISWVDYNVDGLIDFFQASSIPYLYKNNGNLTFKMVTLESGLFDYNKPRSSIWFDLNNDRYPDLFLVNRGFNKVFKNNGDGTFTNISEQSGLKGGEKWNSSSACVGDYNNDGYLDIYVVNISTNRNAFYVNNGDETFTDITDYAGVHDEGDGRTCSFVDFNSDGYIDIFTTNHIRSSKLYKNLSNGKFEEVAYDYGLHVPSDIFSATWGDFNGDAVMDVFMNGHVGIALYEGIVVGNNSITVELVGDGINTNTSAIGSRIELKSTAGKQIREVLGGKGCCEQDMLPAHFGLGKESLFDLNISWTSGKTCTYKNLNAEDKRIYKVWEKGCEVFSY